MHRYACPASQSLIQIFLIVTTSGHTFKSKQGAEIRGSSNYPNSLSRLPHTDTNEHKHECCTEADYLLSTARQ